MKKRILIIGAFVIVLVGIAVYALIARNSDQVETPNKQAPVVNFNNQGDGVRYSASEKAIELYDSKTDEYERIAPVESEPAYSEISSDKKFLLYANEVDSYNGEENFSVINLGDTSEVLSKSGIYSPRFMPDNSVVYQAVGDNASSLTIVNLAGKNQTVSLPTSEQVVIEPINNDFLAVYEFSSDVGESAGYLINVKDNSSTKLGSGEGLKIKTVLASRYLAIQTISNDKTVVQIIEWQTNRMVRKIEDIALDDMDWLQNTYYVFAKSGIIYQSSFGSSEDAKIADAPDPIVMLRLVAPNKLFIVSPEKSYTTTI